MKKIYSLLYSYADWNKIARHNPTLEIIKDDQIFYYFGANHSHDPQDEQYPRLRKYWEDFLQKTKSNKRVFLVEGGVRAVRANEEEAIRKGSEGDLVTLWASKLETPIFCPEPKRSEEYAELLKEYSKEEIAYYFFARVINQWHRHLKDIPDFEEYMNSYLKADQKASGWEEFYFSIISLKEIHKKIFNTDFNKDDKEFFATIINPTKDYSVINKIPRALSTFRDATIVSGILKCWQEGQSIFAVFGGGHVIVEDRALKELLV